MPTPEELARIDIDAALARAGWVVQDVADLNVDAAPGVAVREFPLAKAYGEADYLLYVKGSVVGVIEAKKAGDTLAGVEVQAEKYAAGIPAHLPAPVRPLPFLYQSTGVETQFTSRLDPQPRSRAVFHFHRPETLAAWLAAAPVPGTPRPSSLRGRLQALPPMVPGNLWEVQARAVTNLEASFRKAHPRALIQMATGSGKTFTAIASIYRLVKDAGAARVLFLVDRDNLGKQALKEFQNFATPDDGRKFTELYNVQRLTSNKVDPVAKVVITTIQRLYSMLKGEEDVAPEAENAPLGTLADLVRDPVDVAYNAAVPPETFDVVFVDECHRSIYTLWRQVLEYFDAFLVGLTATPSKQTFGFFHQNLVMEYGHAEAVADGVNVDFTVYKIRTKVTEQGATVEREEFVGRRARETRKVRWEKLDDDLTYGPGALDRDVVAPDQIRTVVRTFRDKLFTEIFPGRTVVPKTLIFAKDDSHADDIVRAVRTEFGEANEFCEKITYKTGVARIVEKVAAPDGSVTEKVTYKSTGVKPDDLLNSFRNSFNPRVAVTVDMIATGTDVKPLEVVMFMRQVKSRNLFVQMKGRGVRVIDPEAFRKVTPDAAAKDRFVLVDCVGACETELVDTTPLDRCPSIGFEKLLLSVAQGSLDPDLLSTLAGRLSRLDRRLSPEERAALAKVAGGPTVADLAADLVRALDPDVQADKARADAQLPPDAEPSPAQLDAAAKGLLRDAVKPLRALPALRQALSDAKRSLEQTIDETTKDEVLYAGQSDEAREQARSLVSSFEDFCAKHRDDIAALQVLYSRPHRARLSRDEVKALADAIAAPPRRWTPDGLWRAYEALAKDKVRGASSKRIFTDVVSLVRFALRQEPELAPFPEQVRQRFEAWLLQQQNQGRTFTAEQRAWLEAIRDHVAGNLEISAEDLEYAPFTGMGGAGKAHKLFGAELGKVMDELAEVLAA